MAKPLPEKDPKGLPPTADEELKEQLEEAELKRVLPEAPANTVGPDTTGVGQPDTQAINQGQSLPQSRIPVEKKFEKGPFYDPAATERAIDKKDLVDRGAKKTDV